MILPLLFILTSHLTSSSYSPPSPSSPYTTFPREQQRLPKKKHHHHLPFAAGSQRKKLTMFARVSGGEGGRGPREDGNGGEDVDNNNPDVEQLSSLPPPAPTATETETDDVGPQPPKRRRGSPGKESSSSSSGSSSSSRGKEEEEGGTRCTQQAPAADRTGRGSDVRGGDGLGDPPVHDNYSGPSFPSSSPSLNSGVLSPSPSSGPKRVYEVATKRPDAISWDDYFMSIAHLSALRSKDPSTQVGACIVNEWNRIVGIGYNGFPAGCDDDRLPWSREAESELDTKYPYVCHAEMNAILNTNGAESKGCRIYVKLFPCNECAKLIIQSGIREVVYLSDKYHETDSCKASRVLFDMSGVRCRRHEPKIGEIRIDLRLPEGEKGTKQINDDG